MFFFLSLFAGEDVAVATVCEIKENFYTPASAAVFLVPQQLSGCALPSNEGLFNRCQPHNYYYFFLYSLSLATAAAVFSYN